MSKLNFIKLGSEGTSYDLLKKDWKKQCDDLDEDFETYSQIPFAVFDEIIAKDKEGTGLFALVEGDRYHAVCMLNHTYLPGYDGPVLRVRHILLSPQYDLGDTTIADYSRVLVSILSNVIIISISHEKLKANHIKFHTRSPADMQFFAAVGQTLDGSDLFASVQHRGAWLYITRQ
ncbi:hypothetical protein [Mariluticola halotolerans]|uniref:hypothetical protein n=1 Tax=Mariluticola halotolerans TaxID=2909283 RepID=UPI0026E220C6|nr:hypothetical protein [Mariluticola halotolerans]UJQ95740.1 hypothetical protein L1P08_07070 [Mariluticola halotolerans]